MLNQKKATSATALMLMGSLLLTACGNNSNEASLSPSVSIPASKSATPSPAVKEAPVELTMYIANSPVKDLDRIMEAANKIIKEKINATLRLVVTDWSSYPQKLNLMISSSEPFDLAFEGSWGDLGYFQNASKGAFLDITNLLDKYAPTTKSRVPEKIWQGVKVNGKVYGAINYQVWGMAGAKGIQLRKDLVDKYNFDWKSITKFDDITPFLANVKNGEKDVIGFEAQQWFSMQPNYFGMDAVGDSAIPGWVGINDKNIKVVNQYETQEFKNYVKMLRNWYVNGYVRKDAATLKDTTPDRKAGKVAAIPVNPMPDSVEFPENMPNSYMSLAAPELKVYGVSKRFTEPVISASAPSAAVTVVGANSKHPEKAVQLIELINTNNDLFNLFAFGEEGKDYKKINDKQVEMIPNMYNFNWSEWEVGQSFGRLMWDANANVANNEKMLSIIYGADKTAKTSPIMGFVFNGESVRTQLANVNAALGELLKPLEVGSVDPDKYLPTLLIKLKDAGVDDIIAEKQKQIDAWRAANGI